MYRLTPFGYRVLWGVLCDVVLPKLFWGGWELAENHEWFSIFCHIIFFFQAWFGRDLTETKQKFAITVKHRFWHPLFWKNPRLWNATFAGNRNFLLHNSHRFAADQLVFQNQSFTIIKNNKIHCLQSIKDRSSLDV